MIRHRASVWIAALATVAACAAFALRGHLGARLGPRDVHPFLELRVPRVRDPVPINAETEGKRVWESEAGGTGIFKSPDGKGMVPYTEAKARWMPGTLFLLLYAGDLDLEGSVTERDGPTDRDDSFHIELGHEGHLYTIDVSVLGTLRDADCDLGSRWRGPRCDLRWDSRAAVAVDRDGTLNQVGDNDEEWVVEMAIPLGPLGLASAHEGDRISFSVGRCEVGMRGRGPCGGFGTGKVRGEIVLERDFVDGDPVASAHNPL
jgi:hypothetical protein